jgi:NCS1 nucleoside transporter family
MESTETIASNLADLAEPSAVEHFAIQPIPVELRTVRWPDLFLLMSNFLINPSTIVIGGLAVVSGMSFLSTIVTCTAGIFVVFIGYIIMATVGVDYGITGQVTCRMVFGIRGAKWLPSTMRTIASVYWFAVQTVIAAAVVVTVLRQTMHREFSPVWTGLVLAAFQVVLALFGYNWLKMLSRFGMPVKLGGIVYLFWLFMHIRQTSYQPSAVLRFHAASGWTYAICAIWLGNMVAAWLTMITDAADFCRYTRSRKDMWWGTMLGAVLANAFSVSLGAYGAAASLGREANPFSLAAEVDPHWRTLLILLVVIALDETTINVMNVYTGGLSLSNVLEKTGRFWNTLAVGAVSTVLAGFPVLLTRMVPFTTALGNLFAPLAGVLIFHYVFVERMKVDVAALFDPAGRYRYWHGINRVAVVWCFLGCGFYYMLPVAALPAVLTPIVTGVGYLATVRLLARGASNPEEANLAVEVSGD